MVSGCRLCCTKGTTTTNVFSIRQALAAQMAAVVADAEWLEPHERDAVQQLLRNEYTADAPPPPPPPPPPPQEYQRQSQPRSQQEPQKQQQSAAQSASQSGQRQISSNAAAAEQQDLGRMPPGDAMEEPREQAAGVEAAAAGQRAERGMGAAEDAVPPGVPAEAVRLLRCSTSKASSICTPPNCCYATSSGLAGSVGQHTRIIALRMAAMAMQQLCMCIKGAAMLVQGGWRRTPAAVANRTSRCAQVV